MKKFLSLVLALVMTMSLVTVSVGAKDFTDSDELSGEQYEEAVNVMSEMGIIDGYAGGNFQPQGTLTRGAAAKIIACMMLGKTTAEALGTSAAPFKDVPAGSTFAGYIAYCVESGLIDGYADGTFRPQNTLTGFAFLKMLLTALGYDSTIEGYTGANWTVNVMGRAQQEGLTTGDDEFVGSRALTREEACLFAVNTLRATLVEYDSKGTNVTVNGATVAIGASKPTYVTSSISGAATAIDDTKDNTTHDYTVEFGERYQPDLKLVNDADDFDRPARTWNWKGRDIGTYVDYEELVAEYTTSVTGKELYELLTKSIIDDYTVEYYVDGQLRTDVIKNSNMIRTNTTKYDTTGNGVLTQVFVDNDDELVTITSINTYLAEATADYNAKKGTLSIKVYQNDYAGKIDEVLSVDDFAIENYKEGDMLRVNVAETSKNKYEVIVIDEPEVLSDSTVTKFSNEKYLVTDGTQYDYAKKGVVKNDLSKYYDSLLDNTYDVYMDAYGYVLGTVKVSGDLKYLFLTGYDLNGSNLFVSTATAGAIFLDGSFEEIQVDVQDTNKNLDTNDNDVADDAVNYPFLGDKKYTNSTDGESEYNMWFSYTVDKDGVYTLKPVPAGRFAIQPAESKAFNINSAGVRVVDEYTGVSTKYAYGNDDSVYITVETGTVDKTSQVGITEVNGTYTGVQNVDIKVYANKDNALTNMSEIENASGYPKKSPAIFAVYDEDLYIIGAVVIGEDANSTENYAFAVEGTQNEYVDADGNYYWDFIAVTENEVKTLTVKEKGSTVLYNKINNSIDYDEDAMWKLTYDTDGYVIDAELVTDKNVKDDVYGASDFNNTPDPKPIDPDLHKVYDVRHGVSADLRATGRTLYVSNKTSRDVGLTIASDAIIVVVQREQTTGGDILVEDYTTFTQAVDALEDANNDPKDGVQFKGEISAVLNDRGTAEFVILKSTTPVDVDTDDGSTPNGDIAILSLTFDADSKKFSVSAAGDGVALPSGKLTMTVKKDGFTVASRVINNFGGRAQDTVFAVSSDVTNGVVQAKGEYTVYLTLDTASATYTGVYSDTL